jgi:hypothetical protein
MKNKLLKLYILGFFILTDFIAFAQPGDNTGDGDLEDGDPDPVPINGKLIYLGISGLFFAFYTYRKNKRIA